MWLGCYVLRLQPQAKPMTDRPLPPHNPMTESTALPMCGVLMRVSIIHSSTARNLSTSTIIHMPTPPTALMVRLQYGVNPCIGIWLWMPVCLPRRWGTRGVLRSTVRWLSDSITVTANTMQVLTSTITTKIRAGLSTTILCGGPSRWLVATNSLATRIICATRRRVLAVCGMAQILLATMALMTQRRVVCSGVGIPSRIPNLISRRMARWPA